MVELLVTSILPPRLSDAIPTKNRAAGWPQCVLNSSFSLSFVHAGTGGSTAEWYQLGSGLQRVPGLPLIAVCAPLAKFPGL